MRLRSGSLTVMFLEVCSNALMLKYLSIYLKSPGMLNAIYCELLNLQQQREQQTLIAKVGAISGHHQFSHIFGIVVS